MTEQASMTVLRRMAARPVNPVAEVSLTAARALRLSMTRSAEREIGLVLTVLNVSEERLSLEALLEQLEDGQMFADLTIDEESIGVMALDPGLVAAIVEVRTTGQLSTGTPELRPVTAVDFALAEPIRAALLTELAETTENTTLEGWVAKVRSGDRVRSVRALGLRLEDLTYRVVTLKLDLGAEGREGSLVLALPVERTAVPASTDDLTPVDWAAEFRETVMASPAMLDVILHRMDLPLSRITGFSVGQMIPLTGCSVGAVRIEDPEGVVVARGRLGQKGGHIAVRIETPAGVEMTDLPREEPIWDAEAVDGAVDVDLGQEPSGLEALPLPADPDPGLLPEEGLAEEDFSFEADIPDLPEPEADGEEEEFNLDEMDFSAPMMDMEGLDIEEDG